MIQLDKAKYEKLREESKNFPIIFTVVSAVNYEHKLTRNLLEVVSIKVDKLDMRVESLEDKVDKLDMKVESLEDKVDKLDMKVESLDNKVNKLDMRVENLENKVESLEDKVDGLIVDMGEVKSTLSIIVNMLQKQN